MQERIVEHDRVKITSKERVYTVIAKLYEFVWEYLRPLLGIKKMQSNSH